MASRTLLLVETGAQCSKYNLNVLRRVRVVWCCPTDRSQRTDSIIQWTFML